MHTIDKQVELDAEDLAEICAMSCSCSKHCYIVEIAWPLPIYESLFDAGDCLLLAETCCRLNWMLIDICYMHDCIDAKMLSRLSIPVELLQDCVQSIFSPKAIFEKLLDELFKEKIEKDLYS